MQKFNIKLFLPIVLVLFLFSVGGCSTENTSNSGTKELQEKNEVKSIGTDELRNKIETTGWVVVDTRINDAFNGWPQDGMKRGGHIKGAVDFSANWLKTEVKNKEQEIEKVLKGKGITPDKNVVLYDANGKDRKAVAQYLINKGFKNIYEYDVKEWAANESYPMEAYPNYQLIVPAVWVNDLIKNNNNGKPYKIFEVSWGAESKEYKAGHIPGAVHINTDEVEEGPIWNRLADPRLEKFAENNGITVDTTVVLYGADPMAAYRVAAILKYMGAKDVRVLNGGWAAWENEAFPVETKPNQKQAVADFGAKVPLNKSYIVDMPEVKQILADKNGSKLVDIRSWVEYIGQTSGYDYIKGKGRPAGAVWGHAGSDPSNLQDFRNLDNTMRNGSEILKFWAEEGITPDQKLSFYCGTGWRAAEVLIYADVMGLKNISLYDGGWNEWSNTPGSPIETGEPKKN